MSDAVSHSGSATLLVGAVTTHEFRTEFKKELLDTVVHGRHEVLEKLFHATGALSQNDQVLDAVCRAVEDACAEDIQELLKLAKKADAASGDSKAEEQKMYRPLGSVMRTVEHTLAQPSLDLPRVYFRQLCSTSSRALAKETGSHGVEIKPDFVIVEVPPPQQGTLPKPISEDDARWSRCPTFIEVKAKTRDIPHNTRSNDATIPLTQAADYARIILAARPFQLYAYGVLFCGHSFVLALFDRRGIVVSPAGSIQTAEGRREFIRILIRLLWDASPQELGHDPTVSLQPNNTYFQDFNVQYPRFIIRTGKPGDTRRWTTFDPPMWTSPSLLGRGTSVWRTLGPSEREPSVVKISWRTQNRTSEAKIYETIAKIYADRLDEMPRGMATFRDGGDVEFGGSLISAYRLRQPDPYNLIGGPWGQKAAALNPALRVSPDVPDLILHRVTISDVGKPLWEYTDVDQLAKVLYMVVCAHRDLCKHGIVHRDISAGNILIRTFPRVTSSESGGIHVIVEDVTPPEGFLTDFELAKIADTAEPKTVFKLIEGSTHFQEVAAPEKPPKTKAGDTITGTALFMATNVLKAINDAQQLNLRTVNLDRGQEHDVESFFWVIIFVLYKRALLNERVTRKSKNYQQLNREFCALFSAKSIGALVVERMSRLRDGSTAYDGIRVLLDYLQKYEEPKYSQPLRDFLTNIWRALKMYPSRVMPLDADEARKIQEQHAHRVAEYQWEGCEPPTLEELLQNVGFNPSPAPEAVHMELLGALRSLLVDIKQEDWLEHFLAKEKERQMQGEVRRQAREEAKKKAQEEAEKKAQEEAEKKAKQ